MKIESNKIGFKKMDENIQLIFNDMEVIKFWSPELRVPFGVDENFGKHYIRLELEKENKQHQNLKKIIDKVESILKKKKDLEDFEMKSIFRRKMGENDLMDLRLKQIKSKVITEVEYENKRDNYLKTVYDIEKESIVKIYLEVHGFWDYRIEGERKEHKVGLILNALKIKVLDKKYSRNNQEDFLTF